MRLGAPAILALIVLIGLSTCGYVTGRYDGNDPGDSNGTVGMDTDDDDDSEGGIGGKKIEDFIWTTVDGDELRLYDYKGNVILLNVAAWWCAECKEETPILENSIWSTYRNEEFILIQLLTEDAQGQPADTKSAEDWRDEFDISFPLCLDPDWSLRPYFTQQSLPFLMLIDKNLVIQEQVHGFDEEILKVQIEELL